MLREIYAKYSDKEAEVWRATEDLEERRRDLKKMFQDIKQQKSEDMRIRQKAEDKLRQKESRPSSSARVTCEEKVIICGEIELLTTSKTCNKCKTEIPRGSEAIVMNCNRCTYHRRCVCEMLAASDFVCQCQRSLVDVQ